MAVGTNRYGRLGAAKPERVRACVVWLPVFKVNLESCGCQLIARKVCSSRNASSVSQINALLRDMEAWSCHVQSRCKNLRTTTTLCVLHAKRSRCHWAKGRVDRTDIQDRPLYANSVARRKKRVEDRTVRCTEKSVIALNLLEFDHWQFGLHRKRKPVLHFTVGAKRWSARVRGLSPGTSDLL